MEQTEYFLLGQVARILRTQPYKLVYMLTTNPGLEPRLRIGNKRIFTIADMQRIGEKLQLQTASELVNPDGTWKLRRDHD